MSKDKADVIQKIKGAISFNNPVIINARIPASLLSQPKGKCHWKPGKTETSLRHALVIVAYSADYFEVLNSLGCRWGCDGFVKIPCAELAGMVDWAFIMNPMPCG